MTKFILFDIQNRIASITLNRPEKRNAINPQFIAELIDALKKAESDHDVKAIVLKSSGNTFSAGADLDYLNELRNNTYEHNLEDSKKLRFLFSTIYKLDKPIIAQVEGDAIAGGCGLVSACDIVFSVPEALFGYTEVKIGFVPALVAAFLLRKIGEGRCREMLLSGDLINAQTAYQYGLVNFIEEKHTISNAVITYVERLVQTTSSQSIKAVKTLLAKIQAMPIHESLNYASKVNAEARMTEDFKKGIDAFLKKKRPNW